MSEAFHCDGCGERWPGSPAFEGTAHPESGLRFGSETAFGHRAGVSHANPDKEAYAHIEWPLHSTRFDLCGNCLGDLAPALVAILEGDA